MAKRITTSLPDDLADEARRSGDSSGYIAEALREQRRVKDGMAALERLWGPGWQGASPTRIGSARIACSARPETRE
ncbi:hypothetical protein [Streptosporangium sp. NPDC049078]|uniref:hypothetical protein n=1 Tax=Streptosporangium sp. NPDC049078 TaxID=3155767 RepID=UPI003427DAA9